jgi:Ca-activated chloride channel homolog
MRIIFYIFLCSFINLKAASAQISKPLAEIGQSDYLKGNFKEAAKNFGSALSESPDNASLAYNLANSQYRQGQFDKALQSFNQAATLSQNSTLKQNAYYNSGNVLFNLGKLEQAIDSYKKALELDPNDLDTKYNLEFSREQLKKRQKKDDQKKSSNNNDKNSEKQDSKKSDSQDKNKDSKENQESNSQQDDNEKNPDSKKPKPIEDNPENSENNQEAGNKNIDESQSAEISQQDGLSKQQAEQWLLSINENRKKFGQMKAKKLKPNPKYRGKDW